MVRIPVPDGPDAEVNRLWGMSPELAGPAMSFMEAVIAQQRLPMRVRELMRMRIALINHCVF